MLSFTLFESIDESSISIKKIKLSLDTKFSDEEKKQLENLFNQLTATDKKILPTYYFNRIIPSTYEKEIESVKKTNNHIIYLLCDKNNNIIGFCRVMKKIMLKDTNHISTLIIDKKYRNKGYGRYFLNYVLDDLKKDGSPKLFSLNCIAMNEPAKKLYSSLGFITTSQFMVKNV